MQSFCWKKMWYQRVWHMSGSQMGLQVITVSVIKLTVLALSASLSRPWAPQTEVKRKAAQSCLTLCNPTDCIAHGILQAGILERVAFPFSRVSSQPRDRTQVLPHCGQILYQLSHSGLAQSLELSRDLIRVLCPPTHPLSFLHCWKQHVPSGPFWV